MKIKKEQKEQKVHDISKYLLPTARRHWDPPGKWYRPAPTELHATLQIEMQWSDEGRNEPNAKPEVSETPPVVHGGFVIILVYRFPNTRLGGFKHQGKNSCGLDAAQLNIMGKLGWKASFLKGQHGPVGRLYKGLAHGTIGAYSWSISVPCVQTMAEEKIALERTEMALSQRN